MRKTAEFEAGAHALHAYEDQSGLWTEHERSSAMASALQAQLHRGFLMLRFQPALEPAFRAYLRGTGQRSRLTMLLIGLLSTLLISFIDISVLGLPADAARVSRWMQLGLQVPGLAIAALAVLYWPRARVSEWLLVAGMSAMLTGLMVQRVADARLGFYLPLELIACAMLAMFTLARVQFWIMMLASFLGLALVFPAELVYVAPASTTYYHLFCSSVILSVAACSGYSIEYFIRWTWLNDALLRYMARHDGLTGLFNRPALEYALDQARAFSARERRSYALALIDIDFFGDYNDHFGHQDGDSALRQVAGAIGARARRPNDVCGRYGGEEFILLWSDTSLQDAMVQAEATLEAIEKLRLPSAPDLPSPHLTISIGLCWVTADAVDTPLKTVIRYADQALYGAKSSGRNCLNHKSIEPTATRQDAVSESASSTAAHPVPPE